MHINIYGTCEKCGVDLKETDTFSYFIGRRLCSKCRALEPLAGITGAAMVLDICEICGAAITDKPYITAGRQLCSSCEVAQNLGSLSVPSLSDSIGVPSLSGTISANIGGLEKGIDWDSISTLAPRDEQIARLQAKIEELESTGYADKEELNSLKQRLTAVEKKVPASRDRKVPSPTLTGLDQVLTLWFPRRIRKYEETYKAELAEHLSHTFLHVREEAEGGLCDILVAKRHPIHLKVNPGQSEYDILCGQILRTLEKFKHVACVIIGIPSSDHYNSFKDRIQASAGTSKVRFFPKAR